MGIAVVTIDSPAHPGWAVVDLTRHGRLRVPSISLDLVAVD
jgi:hypothetical protein